MTVDELGFPKADVSAIREIAKRRTGLTLITGAVRTGKNTTVLAIANELQKLPIQIVEYSNPVEVRMGYAQKDYHGDINN
ncbi:ATPase, T2SS/T4P/T4SS family [Bacteroides acidifaciens]|uniref:ATPase, T2SS/T4P/T4SS family n=1 Tax=Bacteroides acidifaciens TaxID=85831 RepID=UPI0033904AA0